MDDNVNVRLTRVEKEVGDLEVSHRSLESTINNLNITMALLQQTLKSVKTSQEERAAFNGKIMMFMIGGFLSAVVAFVIRGGLIT